MNGSGNHLRVDPEDREDIRIAVVLNGGVSLAVWMGGVVNEINRLVRSRPDGSGGYGGLLGLVGATARVDVIAGTSAGGINGALLAYAQVYDADLSGLGARWAELGSFEQLLRHHVGVGRQEVEVLRHTWLVHIGIHGLRAEYDHIVAPPQEFQHRFVHSSQR